ncbi:glycoside hydrolase family 31 protein [Zasmidium cellare ATCC 36951]|uniref:alpha-glucosidase n=1 Tax=Zasmidium cellare ATCC 36951 TaxID=1080233 RepID=A0A6A6CRY2_ZASCE|nr:glycoside hydrolase family 31 protein [Zasmidium cellare ATCC 36951]KAF2168529.1 glycoside hydrolase family 31 protein [Zasmidium cellare ATCC 36951]
MAATGALFLAILYAVNAQTGTERPVPTLSPQINAAPSLTPTIYDAQAPDPQKCPGYTASNVHNSTDGFNAELTIAGSHCQAFGNDIDDLLLEVQYQTQDRLNVKIYPRYIGDNNRTQYLLSSDIVTEPEGDGHTTEQTSRLKFEWTNDPTFQFRVLRAETGEELFSTYGHVIVYEDQFLELATDMVDGYNVYGLAENIHDFHLGNNHTQTFYAVDAGNTVDGNVYGTFPFYQETRYHEGKETTSHGVYARNAHGQEWLLRDGNITYRTLGGSFDLYFLSGQDESGSSSALETIRQFQVDCVGTPAMQQFWTFGFHQTRWGYENISVMRDIAKGYKDANIPLEALWNDIDIYDLYKDFTSDNNTFPAAGMQQWISELHQANQYYVPIIDSNIYAPNLENESDAYGPWERGAELGIFIRDPTTGDPYYGNNWPGFSSWADWLLPESQDWWTNEILSWFKDVPFDGIWIDLSEASSFCVGSCGNGRLNENPVHPPFLLPNDPGNADFRYPEGFNISNATEAASASAASASQASMLSTTTLIPVATTTTQGRTEPTPGVRNLNFPPYVINHVQAGHSLLKSAIAPNATHNDPSNTTEYELHNVYGLQISNATYHALLSVFPGRRPFTVGRSTFAGSGRTTSHWGGDNTSTWGSMFLSISQALTFMMSGIPMFGADTCGFAGNTDYDLCSRWMELSAFFPFYRNHNVKATISQEAYIWSSVAEASRRVMAVRYSLLNYMYTLFYHAHTKGDAVMRALAWEFPQDRSLKGTYTQFLLGPSLLVTPVLIPNAKTVRGVFPGIGEGTRWYDWYTLKEVQAKPQENVTLEAPLEHINVHVRGGSILPLQQPGYTTTETRNGSYSLLVALDSHQTASGSLYLDDGYSLVPEQSKLVQFKYADGVLSTHINGTYKSSPPLANVTLAGVPGHLTGLSLTISGQPCEVGEVAVDPGDGVLRISGLEEFTPEGAWEGEMVMKLSFD